MTAANTPDLRALVERLERYRCMVGALGKAGMTNGAVYLLEAIEDITTLQHQLAEMEAALCELADEAESRLCQHEDTHRGGCIWTICDGCGRKWADDEGGFRPYETPAYIRKARSPLKDRGEGR